MMVRGYLSERATGGAVASSPYRGRPWRGWMSLGSFSAPENEQPEHVGASPCIIAVPHWGSLKVRGPPLETHGMSFYPISTDFEGPRLHLGIIINRTG